MRVTLHYNDGKISSKEIGRNTVRSSRRNFIVPDSTDKLHQIQEIVGALSEGNTLVLFDASMRSSSDRAGKLLLHTPDDFEALHDASALFFTSGTSGNPIGVVKSIEHLKAEVQTHVDWLARETFEVCLVTVPLFHIYGFLFGLLVPDALNLEIVTKEDFLPHEIVGFCTQKPTLCITNPVFIRSMIRLRDNVDLSSSLFICSSGPLEPSEAALFEVKYSTRLVQLYGSSETGGIAIRSGEDSVWKPLKGVNAACDEEGILSIESPFVSDVDNECSRR
jgi:acyl-coenzyme A synthetase/AMP-(fatty) acid ligase